MNLYNYKVEIPQYYIYLEKIGIFLSIGPTIAVQFVRNFDSDWTLEVHDDKHWLRTHIHFFGHVSGAFSLPSYSICVTSRIREIKKVTSKIWSFLWWFLYWGWAPLHLVSLKICFRCQLCILTIFMPGKRYRVWFCVCVWWADWKVTVLSELCFYFILNGN